MPSTIISWRLSITSARILGCLQAAFIPHLFATCALVPVRIRSFEPQAVLYECLVFWVSQILRYVLLRRVIGRLVDLSLLMGAILQAGLLLCSLRIAV